jgi:hypothetical protein
MFLKTHFSFNPMNMIHQNSSNFFGIHRNSTTNHEIVVSARQENLFLTLIFMFSLIGFLYVVNAKFLSNETVMHSSTGVEHLAAGEILIHK